MENLPPELLSFWQGLPVFLVQSLTVLLMIGLSTLVYMKLTRHDEMALIRAGNSAAALSLAGAVVGMALPAAAALASSITLLDVVIWTLVALIFQIVAFRLCDRLVIGLPERIQDGDMGAATLLVAIKMATALVNTAAIGGGTL